MASRSGTMPDTGGYLVSPRAMAAGEKICAIAMTEPGGGSDLVGGVDRQARHAAGWLRSMSRPRVCGSFLGLTFGPSRRGPSPPVPWPLLTPAGSTSASRRSAQSRRRWPRRSMPRAARGRGGLQLEVEAAAKSLAQRQSPGSIDPRPERRVDHQLHSARLVEEPLEDDLFPARDHAQRRLLSGDIRSFCGGGSVCPGAGSIVSRRRRSR